MRTHSLRRSPVPVALAAALLTALLIFAVAPAASAHDALIGSDPAADSTVDTLPQQLTLTFNEALIDGEGATAIQVTDAAGNSVTNGDPVVDGAVVTQPLATGSAGVYHVLWHVVSSDGHPVENEFSFTVTTGNVAAPSTPSAEPTPTATQTVAPATTAPVEPNMTTSFSISPLWIVGVSVFVLIAAFLTGVSLYRRRQQGTRSSTTTPPLDSDTPAER